METLMSGTFCRWINPMFEYKGKEGYTLFDKIVKDYEKSSTPKLAESGYDACHKTIHYIMEMLEELTCESLDLPSFTIMQYDWDEEFEDYEKKATPEGYNPDRPNFYYKPTGLKVWWYKYPFRGAELSQDLVLSTFESILDNCKRELNEIIRDKLKESVSKNKNKRFLR